LTIRTGSLTCCCDRAWREREARLPVTVIAGFLGSGKTTLLNHILASQHGLKIAVIVNEIGEIGIDGELIDAITDDMIELSNGCICCSSNNDLIDAVFSILQRHRDIDYIVVESTGVADPLPIALAFFRSELRDRVRVDSIVTIADAGNFSLDLFAAGAARNQLRYADIVLLNKCDLASADRVYSIEEKIREVRPGARILRTTRCRVPLALILSVGLFQSDSYYIDCADHAHGRHDEAHLANVGFEALSFEGKRPFSPDRFQQFLERLSDNVFRAKGVLWLEDSPKRYLFHLVGQRFTLDESEAIGPRINRIVLIGRRLDHKRLQDQLAECLSARQPRADVCAGS
jgi:G3E family GTPase